MVVVIVILLFIEQCCIQIYMYILYIYMTVFSLKKLLFPYALIENYPIKMGLKIVTLSSLGLNKIRN